jgi:hypothetical protein
MSFDSTGELGHMDSGIQLTGLVLDDIRIGICEDLARIGSTVQRGLGEGIVDVMASIQAQQRADGPGRGELDAMASSIRCLSHQVAALFDVQIHILGRRQFLQLADVGDGNTVGNFVCQVTVEEFMQSIKPPVPRPSLEERLKPYFPHLAKLRDSGYSYLLCARFLRENGITAAPGKISQILSAARTS